MLVVAAGSAVGDAIVGNPLTNAGSIADSFDSPTVDSEHVLLSLLGYDAIQGKVPDEIDQVPGDVLQVQPARQVPEQ